jgi:hypothetical protein
MLTVGVMAAGAAMIAAADQGPERKPAKTSPAPKVVASPASAASPKPAGSPAAAGPAEQALRARVAEYWKVRETTNLQNAYPFYEPDFRKKFTADTFARDFRRLNRFAPEFVGVDALTLDPSGTHAQVKVKLRTKPDVLGGQELISVTEESWVLADGEWWKAAEPMLPSL